MENFPLMGYIYAEYFFNVDKLLATSNLLRGARTPKYSHHLLTGIRLPCCQECVLWREFKANNFGQIKGVQQLAVSRAHYIYSENTRVI